MKRFSILALVLVCSLFFVVYTVGCGTSGSSATTTTTTTTSTTTTTAAATTTTTTTTTTTSTTTTSTTTSTTTTSTTTSTTTTTAPIIVSGTIDRAASDKFGTLVVMVSTEATTPTAVVTEETYYIATGESTTTDYEIRGSLTDGTDYYIFAMFLTERWITGQSSPQTGDHLGEFADGNWPDFGGTPAGVTYNGSTMTNITFTLEAIVP